MDLSINRKVVVAFDLDDTLYFEVDFLKSAYREISQNLDPDNWEVLYIKMLSLYRCGQDTFEVISKAFNVKKADLIEGYRNHIPEIVLRENVSDFISNIRAYGGRTVIITDGRVTTQMNKIKSLGLAPRMDDIFISEALGTEKPNLNNYKAVEQRFPGCKYLYIGDNPKKDFVGAKKMGWKTVGIIDNGLHIHKESHLYLSEDLKPDVFIRDFSEITLNRKIVDS